MAPFDWRSGDFFSPGFYTMGDMARMMRWYGTLDVPYDAYVCDTSFTHVRKDVRSRTKTLDRMLQEAAVVASTGGAVGYWVGTADVGPYVRSWQLFVLGGGNLRQVIFTGSTDTFVLAFDDHVRSEGAPLLTGDTILTYHRLDADPGQASTITYKLSSDLRTAGQTKVVLGASGK
jgi:hypothetical protein